MTLVVIRSADSGDVEHLVTLLDGGALEERKENPADLNPYLAALVEIQASGRSDIPVAELDGVVVGMCQVMMFRHLQQRGGLCAEVESMHVHSDFRGRGIGEQLLTAAVDVAQKAGCYRVQLTSKLRRSDAHRFYERQGFAPSHIGFKRPVQTDVGEPSG